MNHSYRKDGVSVRLERWGDREHSVTIRESGMARVDGPRFECAPAGTSFDAPSSPALPGARSEAAGCVIEHVSVIAGSARHSIEGEDGAREWSDEAFAIHASLLDARGRFRASATFGGPDCALQLELWIAELEELASLEFRDPPPVERLQLTPNVTAQMVAILFAATPGSLDDQSMRDAQFVQRAPQWGEVDGCGRKVESREVGVVAKGRFARRPAPNWFRPSYRFRPRLAPLHVEMKIEGAARAGEASVRAVSATAFPQLISGGVAAELLCRDDSTAFIIPLDLTFGEWLRAIVADGDDAIWTPHFGGTWGSTAHLILR